MNVSKTDSVTKSLIGFGFPYDKTKIGYLFAVLRPIIEKCDDLKRVGPASLDICKVAIGQMDAYVELDLERWDYIAGKLILCEAGGRISDFENKLPEKNQTLLHQMDVYMKNL